LQGLNANIAGERITIGQGQAAMAVQYMRLPHHIEERQLDHPKYETVWRLMHRIQEAMGKRDALTSYRGNFPLSLYFSILSITQSSLSQTPPQIRACGL